MARIEESLLVDVDPETVWAFVSDVDRCPEWVTFAEEMRHVDDGEMRAGFRYVEYGGVGPVNAESEWHVVEYDPPHRQVHVGDLGVMEARLTIVVEADDGGTRWTQVVEFEMFPRVRPVGKLLERLFVRRWMANGLRETMAAGKRLLDQEATRSGEPAAA